MLQIKHWSLWPFLLVALSACGGGNEGVNPLNYTPPLLVSEIFINTEDDTLTILGQNFDSGDWAVPKVTLNSSSLNVLEQSADEITVVLPTASEFDAGYFLTVKNGDNIGNFDAYGLIAVDSVPSGVFNQLLVLDVQAVSEPGLVKLKIKGYNFDSGAWPPTVTVNDFPLLVDVGNSSPELLVLNIPEADVKAITDIPEDIVLVVQGGTADVQYDAYALFPSLFEEESLLACKRPDQAKVPATGEHCCTTSGQDLCWKAGPLRTDILFGDKNSIPTYFELTEDYVIPIKSYFADPPPVAFPDFDVYKDGDPTTKREKLSGWVRGLPIHFAGKIAEVINTQKWDFLRYKNGNLIIKKGYRWDGASVGEPDFFKYLNATKLVNMRASLVHDAFYDMLRLCVITCTSKDLPPKDGGTNDYRNVADILFYLTAKEDGHSKGLKFFFKTLRLLGHTKARLHAEDGAAWRFHSLANASVSATGSDMVIDDEGNKSLILSCAKGSDELELDAGHSWPIAKVPQPGVYQFDLHGTSWQWTLDGKLLSHGIHEYPMGNLFTEPDKFKTNISMDELTGLGVMPGNDYLLSLHIDKGKNTSTGFFQSEDVVKFRMEIDTEPPVITGITEPLIVWPPHHKYMTFTIEDFVISVTDNCTALSLDDLVITEVTSNEPDDEKGDGHTQDDIVIAADGKSIELRIERQGKGDGRTYTIYIQAMDERGNTTTEPFQVQVPHHHKS